MPINICNIDLVIQFSLLVAGDEDEYMDRQLGPIHIIKYVYLADLSYSRHNDGKSFTGVDWRFYKFGPWSQEVNARIEPALIKIHANKKEFPSDYDDKEDWVRWELQNDILLEERWRKLPSEITSSLKSLIHRFGKNTPILLDYVYKSRPMLIAAPNELLDLSVESDNTHRVIDDVHTLRITTLPNKGKKDFKQKILSLRKLHKQKEKKTPKLINPVINPRYDEVYDSGIAWLDSMAGDPFTSRNFTAEFSNDVWKSTTRKGTDVS